MHSKGHGASIKTLAPTWSLRNHPVAFALVLLLLATLLVSGDGTKVNPPKNSYASAQDVQLGNEAAAQVRREMPILPEDGDIDSYVEKVGVGLVSAIAAEFRHSEFNYEFSVVNARDINAFALPGGPMFVNRGMIEAAHTEGEMAGVMAHELSHVALRHGTAQATKAGKFQIGALGGAILGAIIGGNVGDVVAQGTQIGLGTYMLKFSREYETDADILGARAQIMARAGYDPRDLANMFKTIEEQGGSGDPQWLSDHPNPGNRYQKISEEAGKLQIAPGRSGQQSEFAQTQASLKRMSPAPTMEDISRSGKPTSGNRPAGDTPITGNVEPPANSYRTFDSGPVRLSIPGNWKTFDEGDSVTFAPSGAYGTVSGQSVFTHGAIIGVVRVSTSDLAQAMDQYAAGVIQGNGYLKANGNSQKTTLGSRNALKRTLSGTSPVTRRKENVTVYASLIGSGQLFYLVQVAPGNEQGKYKNAFREMVNSVTFSN